MITYKLTNEKIEVGDIVAYQSSYLVKEGGRPKRKWRNVIGIWEEYWDETLNRYRNRVQCVDKEKHVVYNEKWLKKVTFIF